LRRSRLGIVGKLVPYPFGKGGGFGGKYDAAKARFDEVTEAISAKEAQSERLALFIKCIKEQSAPVAEFDSQLWASMVECVTVRADKDMTVVFRDGSEVSV